MWGVDTAPGAGRGFWAQGTESALQGVSVSCSSGLSVGAASARSTDPERVTPDGYCERVAQDTWAVGGAYEGYVGRWSRQVAASFLPWIGVPPGRRWLDVGCGTGALSDVVLAAAGPAEVVGVDPSPGFVAHGRAQLADPRVRFMVGDARSLPFPDGRSDAVISGLVLNFVPEPAAAAAEMARVATPGGTVAAYV